MIPAQPQCVCVPEEILGLCIYAVLLKDPEAPTDVAWAKIALALSPFLASVPQAFLQSSAFSELFCFWVCVFKFKEFFPSAVPFSLMPSCRSLFLLFPFSLFSLQWLKQTGHFYLLCQLWTAPRQRVCISLFVLPTYTPLWPGQQNYK